MSECLRSGIVHVEMSISTRQARSDGYQDTSSKRTARVAREWISFGLHTVSKSLFQ